MSETAANFAYIEVFFGKNASLISSSKLYAPNGKSMILTQSIRLTDGTIQVQTKKMSVSGTSMTVVSGTYGGMNGTPNGNVVLFSTNEMYILKVVGYR